MRSVIGIELDDLGHFNPRPLEELVKISKLSADSLGNRLSCIPCKKDFVPGQVEKQHYGLGCQILNLINQEVI